MVFPAYCSMSRAMVRDGTGGWRHPLNPSPSARCMAQPTPEIRALRRRLRALRRSLPRDERQKAERAIGNALRHLKLLRRGHRVAVYLAMPGEVSLRPTIEAGWRAGCLLYAPRITSRRRGTMGFVPLPPGARLRAEPERVRHRRAGGEPVGAHRSSAHLDTVLDAGRRIRPARQSPRHGRRLLRSRAAPPARRIAPLAAAAARRPRLRLPGSRVASSRPPGTSRSTSS